MIGAHNTFTYLDAKNPSVNFVKKFWRCQTKSIYELYTNYGVRFFDIKIQRNDMSNLSEMPGKLFKKKYFPWVPANGLAKFDISWNSIDDLLKYMKTNFPEAQYRIILENSTTEEKSSFKSQISKWIENEGALLKLNNYNCSWIVIKNPSWETKYFNHSLCPQNICDYSCRLFNWDVSENLLTNMDRFDNTTDTIEKWANRNNPSLDRKQIKDTNTLYFMDFIGKYGVKDIIENLAEKQLLKLTWKANINSGNNIYSQEIINIDSLNTLIAYYDDGTTENIDIKRAQLYVSDGVVSDGKFYAPIVIGSDVKITITAKFKDKEAKIFVNCKPKDIIKYE